MTFDRSGLFPARFLGFGLFWAWLFISVLSPSPLFGRPVGLAGLPYESCEALARILVLAIFIALSSRIATKAGSNALLALAAACATASTAMLMLADNTAFVTAAAALAAIAETALFLLWMTFFGYMKLGETLVLLALSYAVGAVVALATIFAGQRAMSVAALVLPVLSCFTFVLARRYWNGMEGGALFGSKETAEPDKGTKTAHVRLARPLAKMTVGLALYSFVFALYLGIAANGGDAFEHAYVIEPTSAVVLGALIVAVLKINQAKAMPYSLYRAVPAFMGIGLVLLACQPGQALTGGMFVTLGYLLFEVLAYNDYCNIVKADDASLLKTIAFARLASSSGMVIGWLASFAATGAQAADKGLGELGTLAILALLAVLLTATLAFTDKDRLMLSGIADDRAVRENERELPDRASFIAQFAENAGLTKRETEVAELLISGRNTAYIAEQLFLAESTVRAHVHNIYRKFDVHSRMELLDEFDRQHAAALQQPRQTQTERLSCASIQ